MEGRQHETGDDDEDTRQYILGYQRQRRDTKGGGGGITGDGSSRAAPNRNLGRAEFQLLLSQRFPGRYWWEGISGL